MIGFEEAVERIRSVARPLGTERIALAGAAGRVLSEPVIAAVDSPRADVSTMDGYAVRDADLVSLPASLKVVGESFPGCGWTGAVQAGECARIFTGAPMPAGANRVAIQEIVRREDDFAIVATRAGPARHVRERASDFATGDALLPAGRLLDPRAMVAAAAADVDRVEVHRQPRMQVLSTGDELVEPGQAAGTTMSVPDSASLGVTILAEQYGANCIGRARLNDDLDLMGSAAKAAISQADVVVVTGGASVGEKDLAKAMFEPLGLELIFSTVSIKPGKPAWLGRAGKALIVGLPGNPTSALVTARLLLAPLLTGMRGQPIEAALKWRSAPLASPLPECGTRETFHRAHWQGGCAEILPNQDSGAQKALADAELLVRQRPNSGALAGGAIVQVLAF